MKETELKLLRDKCLLFNQYMVEKITMPPELIEAKKETNRLIEKAYQEGKIKELRAASADIDDDVRHMSLPMALEFKALMKQRLNIDYDIVDKKRIKTIEKVLKKGKISNREEWEVVINRIDEIFADNTKGEELKDLNELLLKYERTNKNN